MRSLFRLLDPDDTGTVPIDILMDCLGLHSIRENGNFVKPDEWYSEHEIDSTFLDEHGDKHVDDSRLHVQSVVRSALGPALWTRLCFSLRQLLPENSDSSQPGPDLGSPKRSSDLTWGEVIRL